MSAIYSYHASESGAMLMRDGVAVADIVDGKVKMREEHKKHAIQAGKFWKAQQLEHRETGALTTYAEVLNQSVKAEISAQVDAVNTPEQKPSIEPVSLSDIMQDLPDVPPMPPMDPQLGTKTPAVVEWYKCYQPEVWAKMHENWINR